MLQKVSWARPMNTEIWWGTPVWFYDISPEDIDTNILEQECYEVMKKEKGVVKSNINGWQSNSFTSIREDTPTINKLIKLVMYKALFVFEDYGIRSDHKCVFNNAWININKKGASNVTHIHPESIISAVFYIKCNINSGKLYLENDLAKSFINNLFLKRDNLYSYDNIEYTLVKGRLIFFPSWVPHGVRINESDEDRISIAFNIGRI